MAIRPNHIQGSFPFDQILPARNARMYLKPCEDEALQKLRDEKDTAQG
jgi:hypothetical protein